MSEPLLRLKLVTGNALLHETLARVDASGVPSLRVMARVTLRV